MVRHQGEDVRTGRLVGKKRHPSGSSGQTRQSSLTPFSQTPHLTLQHRFAWPSNHILTASAISPQHCIFNGSQRDYVTPLSRTLRWPLNSYKVKASLSRHLRGPILLLPSMTLTSAPTNHTPLAHSFPGTLASWLFLRLSGHIPTSGLWF